VSTVDLGPGRVVGEFGLIKLLAEHPDSKALAVAAAAGWVGDRVVEDGPAKSSVIAFASAEQGKRFQSAYGLSADGVVGPQTQSVLNSLQSSDGSTAHFDWSEFYSHDGVGFSDGKVSAATVQENVRRLMYKLEAVRKKAGNAPITVNDGFRSIAHNAAVGGASNSMHLYGVAADIVVSGHTTLQTYRIAETSGFSGLEAYTHSWQHVDSRVQYPSYGSGSWWWESGVV